MMSRGLAFKIILILFLALNPAIAFAACETASQWRLLFVNGPEGEALSGNRGHLLKAIRRGSPIRVGWGEAAADGSWSVEEYAGTTFVNVMAGENVVAQVEPAWIQSHYTDAARAGIRTPLTDWHAVLSTTGRFEAVMIDHGTGKQQRLLLQRTTVHWFAFAPDPACDRRPTPTIAPRGRLNRLERDERTPAE
ncbi:hypothetical protein COC42_14505 [Sphingomonas spermidinifaciens]|uniref:Uncharacterized protein n=1 Tax=Sphingomonas spermidinifaciens TaxID=1141889 RepID=A0A2A4B4D6_9SPHN|nr:hypothetical protein [Sphingomonas spermidinifaciens]PCD02608.1 hypothetical protein COC42_14505 [Sphingomonas spermidinifaciens]